MKNEISTIINRYKLMLPLVTVLMTALVALPGSFLRVDEFLRYGRVATIQAPPAQGIGFIDIDSDQNAELGGDPPERRHFAKAIDILSVAGAKKIAIDYAFRTDKPGDEVLADAIRNSKIPVITAVNLKTDFGGPLSYKTFYLNEDASLPKVIDAVKKPGILGATNTINPIPNYGQYGISAMDTPQGRIYPMYQHIAGKLSNEKGFWRLNMSANERDIPYFKFVDLINGRIPAEKLRGKTWLIGSTDTTTGDDIHYTMGRGYVTGGTNLMIRALGFVNGRPTDIGWLPMFAICCILGIWFWIKQWRAALFITPLVLLVGGHFFFGWLETHNILGEYVPGLVVLVIMAFGMLKRPAAVSVENPQQNEVGSPPNGKALFVGQSAEGDRGALVAVRLPDRQYSELQYQLLSDCLSEEFKIDSVSRAEKNLFAFWLAPNQLAGDAFESAEKRLSTILDGEQVAFGVTMQDGATEHLFEAARANAFEAHKANLPFWSDVADDALFTANRHGVGEAGENICWPVLELQQGSNGGAYVDLTGIASTDRVCELITEIFERQSSLVTRGGKLPLWIAFQTRHLENASVIDHIKFAADDAGTDAASVVIVVDGASTLAPGEIIIINIGELRDKGFHVCLAGLGRKDWAFEHLKTARATELAVSGKIFDDAPNLAEKVIRAAVALSESLDRRLLVTEVNNLDRLRAVTSGGAHVGVSNSNVGGDTIEKLDHFAV